MMNVFENMKATMFGNILTNYLIFFLLQHWLKIRYLDCMEVYPRIYKLLTKLEIYKKAYKYHQKDQHVIYYGVILMINKDIIQVIEEQVLHLEKTVPKNLTIRIKLD